MPAGYPRFVYDSRLEALTPAAFTASSSALGFPSANVKDRREFVSFKTSTTGVQWIRFDLGSALSVGALAIAGHNLGSQGVTGVNLTADNAGAAHPLTNTIISSFNPTNDRAIVKFFTPVSYRYWELGMTVPGGTNAEIGVIFLSQSYLEFTSLVQNGFDPDRQRGYFSSPVGDAGHLIGIVERFKQREFDVEFDNIEPSWVENNYWPFINTNGRKPFFFVWDWINRPDEISYVRIISERISAPYEDVWQSITLEFTGLFDAQ